MAKCIQVKANGERCGMDVANEGERCIWHDPGRRKEAREARRRGARRANQKRQTKGARTADPSKVPDRPRTVEDAVEWASWAVHAVATGEIDARTGHEIGYVLRAFLDGRKHADAIGDRVKELAAKLKTLREEQARRAP